VSKRAAAQKQPAAALLFHRVVAVADRSLRHLREQRLRVPQQQALKHAAPPELILQHLRSHPDGAPGAPDDGAIGHGVAAHEQRDADQPLFTGHPISADEPFSIMYSKEMMAVVGK